MRSPALITASLAIASASAYAVACAYAIAPQSRNHAMSRLTIIAILALSACAPSEAITRAPGETRTAITAGSDSSVGPVRRQCLGAFTNNDPGEWGKEKLK